MTGERDKPEASTDEEGELTESTSATTFATLPESRDEEPVADVLEQSIPVREVQVLRPKGGGDEGSEADLIEQSVEVPLDEDEADR